MAFYFDKSKLESRKIEVDSTTPTCDSPDVKRRMDRIENNFVELDEVLLKMESKIAANPTLLELDAELQRRQEEAEAAAIAAENQHAAVDEEPKTPRRRRAQKSQLPNKPR